MGREVGPGESAIYPGVICKAGVVHTLLIGRARLSAINMTLPRISEFLNANLLLYRRQRSCKAELIDIKLPSVNETH